MAPTPATNFPTILLSTASGGHVSDGTSPHEHSRLRVFIGPMPEKVVSMTETQAHKEKNRGLFRAFTADAEDDMSQIVKDHAFNFFINEGGRVEDWGENEERSTREEMLRRWRDSEWGKIWNRRRKKESHRTTSRWVGGSFEIGHLLGVNMLQEPASSTRVRLSSVTNGKARPSVSQSHGASTGRESFVTARSHPTITSTKHSPPALNMNGLSILDAEGLTPVPESANSSTALLHFAPGAASWRKASHELLRRPSVKFPSHSSRSNIPLDAKGKGKGKFVHNAGAPDQGPPAPPSEVLERTGSAVEETSAGAAIAPAPLDDLEWGDIVLRDRMLARVSYSKTEPIGFLFDEVHNRTARDLQHMDWAEFMVAWREDRIELYDDYNFPGREWITGHKHLAYVIPLNSSKTRLSLYSFVDLTFCLTCTPTSTRRSASKPRWIFSREKEGTNIFVFKVKSRTRAYDWIWQLWRQLGGQIPQTIEIRNPALDTRVKIDVPNFESIDKEKAFHMFSRENIIALCMDSLRSVGDWNIIIERQLREGKTLELTWRVDTTLDWIWVDDDADGRPRDWAVLCGLALKQSTRPAVLEIRLAEHYPAYLHLKNGSRLMEPPAIEGYLERIKPNTQVKQQVYISTHDGNILTLSPARAHPPSPPGLTPLGAESDGHAKTLRQTEVRRGARQLMDAIGVSDLRSILVIRRAFHITPEHSHHEQDRAQDDLWFGIWSQPEERTQSDDKDEGGEEGLAKSGDKLGLRMKRAFELLLDTGRVIRFEAHSCRVAIEWIERLRALVIYWKQRHRIEAREEMDLSQSRRPRLTPHTRVCQNNREPPQPPADAAAPMPALGSLYNWCVLEGCKPIIRGGKVYMRRGLRGQYKLVQLFLIPGYLVQFRVTPKSSLHTSMRKKTNLVDAYVCSGYFAALMLPEGQYKANANAPPRRYQDGLEADDPEEDMLFIVWYRSQAATHEAGRNATPVAQAPKAVPGLSSKRKLLVFRTRSKLERDAWCWALNYEIEKIVRAQRDREEKLRDTGNLMKL